MVISVDTSASAPDGPLPGAPGCRDAGAMDTPDLTSRGYGAVLWEPDQQTVHDARVTRFIRWLAGRGHQFDGYPDLWQWSVTQPGPFWAAVWDYFEVLGYRGPGPVLTGEVMPDVQWFTGATLNYARNALRTAWTDPDRTAIIFDSERSRAGRLTYAHLASEVARVARGLRALGVRRGDRVAALLPNVPEAVIGLLAAASIGAIWSSCSPDFGARAVIDRFAQIEPAVLIAWRRLHLRGPGLPPRRPGRRGGRRPARPVRGGHGRPDRRCPRAVHPLGRPGPAGRRGARAGVRGGALRPSALGGLLLGHHRDAEADHARSRRDRARAPQGPLVPPGPAARGRVRLVHHHRLDDVELPGRRPAGRSDHRALRRQCRLAGPGPAVAAGRRARRHLPGRRRPLSGRLHEGRAAPGGRRRPVGAARPRLDRVAAAARGVRLGVRTSRAGPAARLLLRRHRPVHGLRRALPAAAGPGRRHLRPLSRRGGGGLRRRGPAGGRPGRRAGHHPADAVDAGRLLARSRRGPLPGELLRHLPGGLAAR